MSKEIINWVMSSSFGNKPILDAGGRCGCACCQCLFTADLVINFHVEKKKDEGVTVMTALCPVCKVDAIVHEIQAVCIRHPKVWNQDVSVLKQLHLTHQLPPLSIEEWQDILANLNDLWFNPDHDKQGEQ